MSKKVLFVFFLLGIGIMGFHCVSERSDGKGAATYPEFFNEEEVVIAGYTLDAMEPFISTDGQYLFFNSLNNGIDTSLYYARQVSAVAFAYQGEVAGVNGTKPHLDAVASMDQNNVFYFVSTRNYPASFENYQSGFFHDGAVTGVKPVQGDFYKYLPGWLIMDAEIAKDGRSLYYVNARFTGGALPAEAAIGVAEKQAGFFYKTGSAGEILKNINHPDYLVYAPAVSRDETELYFTRIRKGTMQTEICVAVRSAKTAAFSVPQRMPISGTLVEAPALTADGSRLYYHKKAARDGKYHIFSMQRK